MIVYIESNFVLEVALGQEQVSPAEAILALAENHKIELAFPSFALSEPVATITHRDSRRREVGRALRDILVQLRRSVPHQQVVLSLEQAPTILADIAEDELKLMQVTVGRLLDVGRPIEIDASRFRQALVYRARFNLSLQDSIIYATVLADMQQRPSEETKCFLSRDKEAFADESEIETELASYNCRYIGSFRQGLRFIQRFA